MRPFVSGFVHFQLCALLLLVSAFAATGCTIRLISDYDNVLDQDVTSLQQSTETFLNQLGTEVGTPAALYSANTDFYIKAQASLSTMATRAASQPKSKIVVGEVEAMQSTFSDMQKLHQASDKGLTAANIANTRSALESEFTSILTLELALKSHSGVPAAALAPPKTN